MKNASDTSFQNGNDEKYPSHCAHITIVLCQRGTISMKYCFLFSTPSRNDVDMKWTGTNHMAMPIALGEEENTIR